jgi:hypothetical protein
MWGLLKEAWDELAKSWLTFILCFWVPFLFCAVLGGLIVATLPPAGTVQYSYIVFGTAICVLLFASGAVCWHRHIITGEKTTWHPRIPFMKSFVYAAKIAVVMIVLGATIKVADSIVKDVLMPVFGLLNGGSESGMPGPRVLDAIIRAAGTFAFILILGPWMLSLPEGSLDFGLMGARKRWPKDGKRQYLQAVATIYLLLFALSELGQFVGDADLFILVDFLISTILFAMELSLLSVAYRRNLREKERSAGELIRAT